MKSNKAPVVIEFVKGSRFDSQTHVLFADGASVELPAPHVVYEETTKTGAKIGLDGMSFEGIHDDKLVFWHVYDVLPDSEATPTAFTLTLDPSRVGKVWVRGVPIWPQKQTELV